MNDEKTPDGASGANANNPKRQDLANGKNGKSKDNRNSNKRSGKNKTKSYRHVHFERERPHLTRGESNEGKKPNDHKVEGKGKASAKGKGPQRHSGKPRGSNPKTGSKLKIIPLGGLDAIGKNMTAFECNDDLVLDDAGLMFPDDDHPGIDLILPDYTYVLENADKLRGIIVTHGHEDHTGSLPYLMKDLDRQVPIYATKLTLGLIEGKFAEHKVKNAKLVEIKSGDTVKLGCMKATFFSVNHSIPGAVGVFIESPAGNVLHTGDFKLDQTPIDGVTTDFAALARFSEIGVDLMMSDSTNATNSKFTPSEAEVGKVLSKIIAQAKGRVIIASFASHIHRMQQICDAAVANGRKVVVTGRSMIQNTDIARKLGYLNISDDDLIDAYELKDMPSDEVVIMCTGSQGEPLSALARIANGEHKTIDIEDGDTVIISATPVPGNEKAVTRVVNSLSKIGADIYDKSREQVHVSGHAGAEELKIMLSIVKPKAFLPVHGEVMHLRAHANLAESTGVPEENIFILENGDTLELDSNGIKRGDSVQSGIVYVDGLSVGDTSEDVLNERNDLASMGFASVALAIDMRKRKIAARPMIEMHGITGGDDAYLKDEALSQVTRACDKVLSHKDSIIKEIRREVRNSMQSLLWEKTKQRPMIIVNILEV